MVPKHGFDDRMIAQAIARGKMAFGYFYLDLAQCPPAKFKVVYNSGPLGGTGVRPQGIITAYYQPGLRSNAAC